MNHREHRFSHYVNAYFERVLVGDCWFTAVETGVYMKGATDEARMRAETLRKARGIKPAHLDWYVYQRETGIFGQLELKVGKNRPNAGQEVTIRLLEERKIPAGCAWTIPQVHDWAVDSGFKLHGNAKNIVRELHQRHLAADLEAEGKVSPVAPKDVGWREQKRGAQRQKEALMAEREFENIVLGGLT